MHLGMHGIAAVPLSSGGPAPTYHPSLVSRGRAGSPHAPDGGLHPTSPEALDDLLKQLHTDRRTLEVLSPAVLDCYEALCVHCQSVLLSTPPPLKLSMTF